ncbi:MAG: class I SAM-dependent methyltransferase [candidate division KSB1 bacterium]|nr:class I SAM-dependent methyltransferase [candidate division KSB1 bacterium]MDZ7301674.1 class I SAM-dependent methyltransferase [candidate division KSB1 bacterium]MDZ7314302.1 class I SAM-dependent methyltransferase [candidate division KSB1 bacterium]
MLTGTEHLTRNVCPSCGSRGLSPFYEVKNVPVHSCILLPTAQEALDFPRGDIVLGFCAQCGFVSNLAFDSTLQDYSPNYEDQQCFSPTFDAFAHGLARRLIEKYNLYNKDIVEIGCGKGDFLLLLCELGHNRGVGIDPTFREDRIQSEAAERVIFIKEYYSERYADYHGDLVCCRHTLEHIHSTAEFVSTVRRALGKRLDTVVFFELPDVTRVLQEAAFWDVYYEHCSYFSAGSLARLFRVCGFEVIDLARDFGDQYLLIEARPVDRRSEKRHDLEENVEQMAKDVHYFSDHSRQCMKQWRTKLQQINAEGKRAVVWGSGSKCVAFMTSLGLEDEIAYVVDINPHRHGKFIPGTGKQIMSPDHLPENKPDVLIIMNPIYRQEIQQMVAAKGLHPAILTL